MGSTYTHAQLERALRLRLSERSQSACHVHSQPLDFRDLAFLDRKSASFVLGDGGFGKVFKAYHPDPDASDARARASQPSTSTSSTGLVDTPSAAVGLGRALKPLALKVWKPAALLEATAAVMLLRELELHAECQESADASIVHVYGFGLVPAELLHPKTAADKRFFMPDGRIAKMQGVWPGRQGWGSGRYYASDSSIQSGASAAAAGAPRESEPGADIRMLEGMSLQELIQFACRSGYLFALALEYVPGGTLKQALVRQMIDPSRAIVRHAHKLRFAEDIAEAMSILYRRGVVHRDLKPDNILLSTYDLDNAHAKLADFGLACRAREAQVVDRSAHVISPSSTNHSGAVGLGLPSPSRIVCTRDSLSATGILEYEESSRLGTTGHRDRIPDGGLDPDGEGSGRFRTGNESESDAQITLPVASSSLNESGSESRSAMQTSIDDPPSEPALGMRTAAGMHTTGTAASSLSSHVPALDAQVHAQRSRPIAIPSRAILTQPRVQVQRSSLGVHASVYSFYDDDGPLEASLPAVASKGSIGGVKFELAGGSGVAGVARSAGTGTSRLALDRDDVSVSMLSGVYNLTAAASIASPMVAGPAAAVATSAVSVATPRAPTVPQDAPPGGPGGMTAVTASCASVASSRHETVTQTPSNRFLARFRGSSRAVGSRLHRSKFLGSRARMGGGQAGLFTHFAGTVLYSAPESLKSNVFTPKSEVFSYGMLIYELWKGCPHSLVYQSQEQVDEHIDKIVKGWRPAFPPSWPAELTALIARCWHRDPALRPTFPEVLTVLRESRGAILTQLLTTKPESSGVGCGCLGLIF